MKSRFIGVMSNIETNNIVLGFILIQYDTYKHIFLGNIWGYLIVEDEWISFDKDTLDIRPEALHKGTIILEDKGIFL